MITETRQVLLMEERQFFLHFLWVQNSVTHIRTIRQLTPNLIEISEKQLSFCSDLTQWSQKRLYLLYAFLAVIKSLFLSAQITIKKIAFG